MKKRRLLVFALLTVGVAAPAFADYTLRTLVTFDGITNGTGPNCLISGTDGNFYGITTYGGANNSQGTVFKVSPATDSLTTISTFDGTNGSAPDSLSFDSAGNLYGTTIKGGTNRTALGDGDGTIFELIAGTNAVATLARFVDSNGAQPDGNLLFDTAGNLYGTTRDGGLNGDGTVYELDAQTHELITLVAFDGTDGSLPITGVISDQAGNLYGSTAAGGIYGDGTVFKIDADTHALTTLYNFDDADLADGSGPGNLVADGLGNLYGTTGGGGTNGDGTVFELSGTGFGIPEPSPLSLLAPLAVVMLDRRRLRRSYCLRQNECEDR